MQTIPTSRLFLTLVVIIQCCQGLYAATAAISEEKRDNIEIEAQTVNIMRQPAAETAIKKCAGEEQSVTSGGAVYTRWGRTECPSTNGTTLVYKGLSAGSTYNSHAGGANYICIVQDIKYLSTAEPVKYNTIYGAEYEDPIIKSVKDDQNVPCAVCHTSKRSSKLMIPGTLSCPTSWTEEYQGYLMSESSVYESSKTFECVDKDAKPVPGSDINTNGALFYHVVAACNVGLPCPPVVTKRSITCVVCTK